MKASRRISSLFTLSIISVVSSLLMIFGSGLRVPNFTLIGIFLFVLVCVFVLILVDGIRYNNLIIFVMTLISLSFSFSYELLSDYPLGQDVHAEYYVVRETLYSGKFDPLKQGNPYVPQYYYEIFGFITLSVIVSKVTGLTEIETIKLMWGGLILGLIPIVTFVYGRKTVNSKIAIFISTFLVMAQSTFITTLHSTTKQTLGLFLMTLLTAVLIRYLDDEGIVRPAILSLVLLTLGFSSYHYLVSGVYLLMIILATFILITAYTVSRDHSRSLSSVFRGIDLALILFISWFLSYTLLSSSIVKPIVDIIKGIIYTQRKVYAYDYVYVTLPIHLNYLRLVINGITVIIILLAGLTSFHNLLRKMGNFMDSLIASASLLFMILSISEILGYSTIGVGRLSMIFIVIVSPYFYTTFRAMFSKIRIRKEMLAGILLVLILSIRLLLSTGVLPYAVGDLKNSVFLDPTYRFEASLAYPDLEFGSFINSYDSNKKFCTDVKAANMFYYVGDFESISLIHNYFINVDCITYFNSFNTIRNEAILRVGKPSNLTSFFETYTLSKTKIYDSGYVLAFT